MQALANTEPVGGRGMPGYRNCSGTSQEQYYRILTVSLDSSIADQVVPILGIIKMDPHG